MAKKSDEPTGPIDKEEIAKIIRGIVELERDKEDISTQIKDLKDKAVEAGATKKQINETLRLMKMADEERNILLSGTNRCLQAVGRKSIDPNFM